jgi:hypothetical protein
MGEKTMEIRVEFAGIALPVIASSPALAELRGNLFLERFKLVLKRSPEHFTHIPTRSRDSR